jgi:hemerythrin-like metal-binding protein
VAKNKKTNKSNNEPIVTDHSTDLNGFFHDLRLPLNIILSYSELLPETTDTNESKKYSKLIHQAGESIVEMLNNQLELSKSNSTDTEVKKEIVDINNFFDLTVSLFKIKADEKNVKLTSKIDKNVPDRIITDRSLLKRIIYNLTSNAIKFTENGSVILSVKTNKDKILFSVSDTGRGISKENKDTIFKSFYQVEESDKENQSGVGLGLAVTKSILKRMKGDIEVSSELGKGSSFTISIDLKIPEFDKDRKDIINEKRAHAQKPLNFLVAEDAQDLQDLYKVFVRKTPHTMEIQSNGKLALDRIKKVHDTLDFVLFDYYMPEMNGVEAIKELRAFEEKNGLSQIPAGLISGVSDVKMFKTIFLAGFDFQITKPVMRKDFMTMFDDFQKEEYEHIPWNKNFEIGIHKIDEQHQFLLSIINQMSNRYIDREEISKPELYKTLLMLSKFAKSHFKYEESLFHNTDYKEEEEHIQKHNDFIDKVNEWLVLLEKDEINSYEVFEYLKSWLISHILVDDIAYSKVIKKEDLT